MKDHDIDSAHDENGVDVDTAPILVEIVGARDLRIRDVSPTTRWIETSAQWTSDVGVSEPEPLTPVSFPTCCRIRYRGRTVHETGVASSDSPVWTSLFVLDVFPEDEDDSKVIFDVRTSPSTTTLSSTLLRSAGLTFDEDDGDNSQSDSRVIGTVKLTPRSVLDYATGQRYEFGLGQESFTKNEDEDEDDPDTDSGRGSLALRFRVATDADLAMFLPDIPEKSSLPKAVLVTELKEATVAADGLVDALRGAAHTLGDKVKEVVTIPTTSGTENASRKQRRILVKPGPDPRDPSTKYLTSKQMHTLAFDTPSRLWVDCCGSFASPNKLYLEILGCDGLPNLDVGEAVGDVSDPFVCCVFGDVVVQTPVIDNESSPRWMPWTQRAFCFDLCRDEASWPNSSLYLSVWDYDLSQPHQPIGRVAISVQSFLPNTVYTLVYALHHSSNVRPGEPEDNGTVTIRLRMDVPDERALLLSTFLRPRPRTHVNVRKDKTFRVVRYTCFGEYGEEKTFDLKVLVSYITEILELKRHVGYGICDAFSSLMFWRGQVPVTILLQKKKSVTVHLPLHSTLFFLLSNIVLSRPQWLPAAFFFSIAWVLWATNVHLNNHPSPWQARPSFGRYFRILVHGKSPKHKIRPDQARELSENYDLAHKERVERDWTLKDRLWQTDQKIDEVIGPGVGDPFHSDQAQLEKNTALLQLPGIFDIEFVKRLGRWQGIVGRICRWLRFLKLVVTWEEGTLTFWITASCLLLGVLCMVLPMAKIIRFLLRSTLWVFFGPWMKVVDWMWIPTTMEDKITKKVQEARIFREKAIKVLSLKSERHGHLGTAVPSCHLVRHYDRPLEQSHARPFVSGDPTKMERQQPPQHLYGTMVLRSSRYEADTDLSESNAGRQAWLEKLENKNTDGKLFHQKDEEVVRDGEETNAVSSDRNRDDYEHDEAVEEEEDDDGIVSELSTENESHEQDQDGDYDRDVDSNEHEEKEEEGFEVVSPLHSDLFRKSQSFDDQEEIERVDQRRPQKRGGKTRRQRQQPADGISLRSNSSRVSSSILVPVNSFDDNDEVSSLGLRSATPLRSSLMSTPPRIYMHDHNNTTSTTRRTQRRTPISVTAATAATKLRHKSKSKNTQT